MSSAEAVSTKVEEFRDAGRDALKERYPELAGADEAGAVAAQSAPQGYDSLPLGFVIE